MEEVSRRFSGRLKEVWRRFEEFQELSGWRKESFRESNDSKKEHAKQAKQAKQHRFIEIVERTHRPHHPPQIFSYSK